MPGFGFAGWLGSTNAARSPQRRWSVDLGASLTLDPSHPI
jgi:hypothetical protein